jgi:glycerate kinase
MPLIVTTYVVFAANGAAGVTVSVTLSLASVYVTVVAGVRETEIGTVRSIGSLVIACIRALTGTVAIGIGDTATMDGAVVSASADVKKCVEAFPP